jgi:hypothetical protein
VGAEALAGGRRGAVIASKAVRNAKKLEEYLEEHLAPEHAHDYLTEGGHSLLTFEGTMAERAGVKPGDPATKEAFRNLLEGYAADRGEKFVRGPTADRVCAQQFAFSTTKEVQAMFALLPRREREIGLAAFKAAAVATIDFACRLGSTRRGKGGTRNEPIAQWLGAFVVHPGGRHGQLDPHVHGVWFNVCVREDGTTGTIDYGKSVYDNMRLLNAFFNAELAARLHRALNLDVQHDRRGNPTVSFPPELAPKMAKLCEYWSPGARAIKEELAKKGIEPTSKAKDLAHLAVRPAKQLEEPEELWARWRREALAHGVTLEMLRPLFRAPQREGTSKPTPEPEPKPETARELPGEERTRDAQRENPKPEPFPETPRASAGGSEEHAWAKEREAGRWRETRQEHQEPRPPLTPVQREWLDELLDLVAKKLTKKDNYFSQARFITEAVKLAHGAEVSSAELAAKAKKFLDNPDRCVALGETASRAKLYTTKEVSAEEKRLLNLARRRAEEKAEPFASKDNAAAFLAGAAARAGLELAKDTSEAFLDIAAHSRPVATLDTPGGPKAEQLARLIATIAKEGSGFQVVAASASAAGAVRLEHATGITTHTANAYLMAHGRRHWERSAEENLEELSLKMFGKRVSFDRAVDRVLTGALKQAWLNVFGEPPQLPSKTLQELREAVFGRRASLDEAAGTLLVGGVKKLSEAVFGAPPELASKFLNEVKHVLFGRRASFDDTIDKFLVAAVTKLSEKVFRTGPLPQLSSKTLFLLHDAQRLTTREFRELMELAEERGARVLVMGNTSGLPAISHPGSFRALREIVPGPSLQSGEHPVWTLRGLAQDGRLVVEESKELALRAMVRDWADAGGAKKPHGHLLLANSKLDARALNVLAQEARLPELARAFVENGGYEIHRHDRVVFTHGLRLTERFAPVRMVKAGETGTVVAADAATDRLTVKTDRGAHVTYSAKRYPKALELAYAFTTSRAASLHAESIHALAIGENLHTLTAKLDGALSGDVTLYASRPQTGDAIQQLAREAERREFQVLATHRQLQLAEVRANRERKRAAEDEARMQAEEQRQAQIRKRSR